MPRETIRLSPFPAFPMQQIEAPIEALRAQVPPPFQTPDPTAPPVEAPPPEEPTREDPPNEAPPERDPPPATPPLEAPVPPRERAQTRYVFAQGRWQHLDREALPLYAATA